MGQKKKLPDRILPSWFDGKTINEARFCEEYLQTHRIAFANGAFFTPDGRVTVVLSGRWKKESEPFSVRKWLGLYLWKVESNGAYALRRLPFMPQSLII